MTQQVLRRIRFCAGHRLIGHGGKCENLHGHNYVADVTIAASETDAVGRVVDFSEVKRVFKGWIDEHWDHGFIVSCEDAAAIAALESVTPHKIYRLAANPTAENLARHLLDEVGPRLLRQLPGDALRVVRVDVWETDEACATASIA